LSKLDLGKGFWSVLLPQKYRQEHTFALYCFVPDKPCFKGTASVLYYYESSCDS